MSFFRRMLFDLWYLRTPPWDSGISPPELMEYIRTHPPGRALDIGCGSGTNLLTLAQSGWKVAGVDFAPRAIRMARSKLDASRIQAELFQDDATKLVKVSGPFDLVLDIGCFHGVAGKSRYLDQLERVLVSKGHWLMYGFVQQAGRSAKEGLAASDLELIRLHNFGIIFRRDGHDRQDQPSAWFLFQKS
jgi:ubiquinone/menaquinone biosynthesis C-methylase UbiE